MTKFQVSGYVLGTCLMTTCYWFFVFVFSRPRHRRHREPRGRVRGEFPPLWAEGRSQVRQIHWRHAHCWKIHPWLVKQLSSQIIKAPNPLSPRSWGPVFWSFGVPELIFKGGREKNWPHRKHWCILLHTMCRKWWSQNYFTSQYI